MSKDAVRKAIRTFLQAFLGVSIPGLLGWLNDLTVWAKNEGSTPFPDARGLAFLGVSAIVAGVIAVVTLVWNAVEEATGKGFLRTVPPVNQRGVIDLRTVVGVLLLVVLALLLLSLLTAHV